MNQQDLLQKERTVTSKYKEFLQKVREAFNKHCDEIKEEATKKFDALPEDDDEGRKKVLQDQKAELDQTLAELKQLLTQKGAEVRRELEEIAHLREQQGFDLDEELAGIENGSEKHAA